MTRTALVGFAALVGCALLGAACASHQGFETKRLDDGTLRIKCQGALPSCIAHAETVCHGNNYEVLKARDQKDTYGPEEGTGKVEVRTSEAIVRCGAKGQPAPQLPPDTEYAAANPPPPPPPAGPIAAGPNAAQRACVPGSTQACIGPGRCEGGQSCLPDGSAYGPCDCGTLGPPPVAPPAPSAAASAPTPAATATPAAPTSIAPKAPAPAKPPAAAPGAAGPAKPLKK
ncbi:MAG: hypothetical protein QM756_16300 [Polyangiaceae bacterium]